MIGTDARAKRSRLLVALLGMTLGAGSAGGERRGAGGAWAATKAPQPPPWLAGRLGCSGPGDAPGGWGQAGGGRGRGVEAAGARGVPTVSFALLSL